MVLLHDDVQFSLIRLDTYPSYMSRQFSYRCELPRATADITFDDWTLRVCHLLFVAVAHLSLFHLFGKVNVKTLEQWKHHLDFCQHDIGIVSYITWCCLLWNYSGQICIWLMRLILVNLMLKVFSDILKNGNFYEVLPTAVTIECMKNISHYIIYDGFNKHIG